MVRRAEPVSAPRRPHSQSGGNGKGLRRAGEDRARRGDQRARTGHPGGDPAGYRQQSRGIQEIPGGAVPALRRARTAAGGVGALSRPEVEPELPGAAIAARRHREPGHGRPPRLHPGGSGLQHGDPDLPGRDLGQHALPGRQADGDVHRCRRSAAAATGEVLTVMQ